LSRHVVAEALHTSPTGRNPARSLEVRPALNRKARGDLPELKVAADLLARGYKIAFPYGEDWNFDLILCRDDETLERVQGSRLSIAASTYRPQNLATA
jgi:hypothetical protein